jgi:hypothetical protein
MYGGINPANKGKQSCQFYKKAFKETSHEPNKDKDAEEQIEDIHVLKDSNFRFLVIIFATCLEMNN